MLSTQIGKSTAAEHLRLRAVQAQPHPMPHETNAALLDAAAAKVQAIESGVAAGFQMAAKAGPLCAEPLWGVAFQLEIAVEDPSGKPSLHLHHNEADSPPWAVALAQLNSKEAIYGPLSGQVRFALAVSGRLQHVAAE